MATTHVDASFKAKWLWWWDSPANVKFRNKFHSILLLRKKVFMCTCKWLVVGTWIVIVYSCPRWKQSFTTSLLVLPIRWLNKKPEEDIPTPPPTKKVVPSVKDKGKCRKVVVHASFQVSTRSFTKASTQRNVASAITMVGNPTATHYTPAPDPIASPSYSSVTILSVPRKRKPIAQVHPQLLPRSRLLFLWLKIFTWGNL